MVCIGAHCSRSPGAVVLRQPGGVALWKNDLDLTLRTLASGKAGNVTGAKSFLLCFCGLGLRPGLGKSQRATLLAVCVSLQATVRFLSQEPRHYLTETERRNAKTLIQARERTVPGQNPKSAESIRERDR